jgi:hypothetical protein
VIRMIKILSRNLQPRPFQWYGGGINFTSSEQFRREALLMWLFTAESLPEIVYIVALSPE